MRVVKLLLKWLFALFFISAGVMHFTNEPFYMKIMPDYIPLALHRPAVIVSGIAEIVLGVHTFTPLYEGQPRTMEIGVLFDREEDLAERTAAVLRHAGMIVAMNQPWSGRDGLIYSVECHADAHARRALELEVRQDLATDPGFRHRLVHALTTLF